MIGWLVYKREETIRNKFFIDKWFSAANEKKIDLRLVLVEELEFGINNGKAFAFTKDNKEIPRFAVMRLNYPLLSLHLEKMGIKVFNPGKAAEVFNDKRRTHLALLDVVPMMDSAFVSEDNALCPFDFPVVVKGSHSCGGRRVYLCNNKNEYETALKNCSPDSAVVQKLCDSPGKDVRVYVLGKKIIKTMLRQNNDGDFRSNLHQGGSSSPYVLDDTTLGYVEKIISMFDFALVGIDFIFDKDRLVFNEIEDAVGTRMLYIDGNIDIVKEYLTWILQKL